MCSGPVGLGAKRVRTGRAVCHAGGDVARAFTGCRCMRRYPAAHGRDGQRCVAGWCGSGWGWGWGKGASAPPPLECLVSFADQAFKGRGCPCLFPLLTAWLCRPPPRLLPRLFLRPPRRRARPPRSGCRCSWRPACSVYYDLRFEPPVWVGAAVALPALVAGAAAARASAGTCAGAAAIWPPLPSASPPPSSPRPACRRRRRRPARPTRRR